MLCPENAKRSGFSVLFDQRILFLKGHILPVLCGVQYCNCGAMGHVWIQCFTCGHDSSPFSHVATCLLAAPTWLQQAREVAEIYLGDILEAFLQSPTDTHPVAHIPGSSGRNQSTSPKDKEKGRWHRERGGMGGTSHYFLLMKFIGHLLWDPYLCGKCKYSTKPHPSGAYGVQFISLSEPAPPCSPTPESTI